MQRQNIRNRPPLLPRKLVILVAAALAGGPAFAALERVPAAPITFERNRGQFAPDVLFVTRAPQGEIAVRSGDVSIAPTGRPAMRLKLSGANPTPEIEELEPSGFLSNYHGGRELQAVTGVPHFGRLVMKDVYPSVDLALHGTGGELEYDFVVAPGANAGDIRLDLSHADESWIDGAGNLRMRLADGEVTQRAPVAWQMRGDRRENVDAHFEIQQAEAGPEARFVMGSYDRSRELVIDPILSYATYLGNLNNPDYGGSMKFDGGSYIHLARTDSEAGGNFATITKLNLFTGVNGGVVNSTKLDAFPGTRVADLALGPNGLPYVAGSTSTDGMYSCNANRSICNFLGSTGELGGNGDAYVVTLDSLGAVTQLRYIGGSGVDTATGLTVDASGNVYVTGNTRSANFPATVGSYHGGTDVFVAKFSPDLAAMDMAVLLGGSGDDTSSGIAVDGSGNIYVAMNTSGGSGDFPPDLDSSFRHGYLVKLAADGSFQNSIFIGASGQTLAAVALDGNDRPVVAGTSFDYDETSQQVYVGRVSDAGDVSMKRFGGAGMDTVHGLTVVGDSAYVVGETFSGDFPAVATPTAGASGGSDAFVARVGLDGLDYSVRFGGTSDEFAHSLAVAPNGDVYVMGTTSSADFPATGDALRAHPSGASDLFLVKLANQFALSTTALGVAADTPDQKILISRTGSLAGTATVKWTAVNGTGLAGTHYGTPGSAVQPSGTVTFPPGVSAVAIHVGAVVSGPNTIPIIGTASFASPRTFSIALSAPTGGPALGDVTTGVVTISAGTSSFYLDAATVDVRENGLLALIHVIRGGNSNIQATVKYATANGTALAGTHYTATSGTLTFPPGTVDRYIQVPIINNAVANPTRSFRVVLSTPTGIPLGTPTTAVVNILDEDNTVAVASAALAATEGAASVTLQVNRTGSPLDSATVDWTTLNGTGVAGTDFGTQGDPAPIAGTLSWPAGDVSPRFIVVPLIDDALPEATRTFKINLSNPVRTVLGAATTTVTLTDNERGFGFETEQLRVIEGITPNVVLNVRRLGPPTTMVTATWTTANGTAISGQDFGIVGNPAQRSGVLTWAIGDLANKTITIPIINDTNANEPDETFTVSLSTTAPGYTITGTGVATVTIQDDDVPKETLVQFAQAKYLTTEDAGTVTVQVQRSDVGDGLGREVRVNYTTKPGTALAATDYVTKAGTLVWPPGDSSPRDITVSLVNNAVPEPPESFTVVLSSPTPGATVTGGVATATVVILDDDEKFPPRGAIPPGFSMPLDATHGWHVSSDAGAYEGIYALRSDELEDGETAAIQMEGEFEGGSVTFRVRVSSEPTFDQLRFFIDSVPMASWSGTTIAGWQMPPAYHIDPGHHVLRWEYVKDGSVSMGLDAAFIDALVTPAFTP